MSDSNLYSGKCIALITGASRGFGQQIAQLLASIEHGVLTNTTAGSRIVLMSRDLTGLEETKRLVEGVKGDMKVDVVSVDLTNTDTTSQVIDQTLASCGKDFDHAFLFSNAGTLGDPHKLLPDYSDIEEVLNVYKLNVVSPSYLISRFCKHFETCKRYVFNTSSLAALQPFRCTGLYTTSKAAMDMFIKNLVADCTEIRALNYAPGPLDTQMARELRDGSGDDGTRSFFVDLFNTGKILSPEESAKKLMMLIRKNEFDNGAHIDFYDI